MTQPQDANALLMGDSTPGLKFDNIGVIYTGTVIAEPTTSQQTDIKTKLPETWKDGSPKMQILVKLQTTLRDPANHEDDGIRTLYIKGKNLTDAIRDAVKASGARGIHKGGVLTVQYTGDGQASAAGFNPPKLYAASYQPPPTNFAGVGSPAAVAPAVQQTAPMMTTAAGQPVVHQQPVAPAALQQAFPGTTPVAVAEPACPPGVDPAMWAVLTPQQKQGIAASHAAQFPETPPF